MKRTSTTAGFANSPSKAQCQRVTTTVSSPSLPPGWTGHFRLFDLPSEIRNKIYHKVFTPSDTDVNPTKHNTTLRLTFTSPTNPAVRILNRKPGRICVLRPTNFASFSLTSRQIYSETLPILARHTTLHLSGADYDFFHATFHSSTFIGGLLEEVAKYTTHIAIEAPILAHNPRLQDQLVSTDTFPRLRRLTAHSCGPAEVTFSGVPFALSATDAEHLLAKKSWPTNHLTETVGSILDQTKPDFSVPAREGGKTYPVVLKELRSRLTEAHQHGSDTEPRLKDIEVVFKLPLKNTIMSATKTSSITFNASEITVDFDTNVITDVSFHKMQKVPTQYRAISTALAFLDRQVSGPVRQTPRVAQPSNAVSYQPQQ